MPDSRNEPYIKEMLPGRYAWCSCGNSKKQPFCDGTHDQTGLYPVIVDIKEPKRVAWCGCKRSENKPYCDGSHKKYQK